MKIRSHNGSAAKSQYLLILKLKVVLDPTEIAFVKDVTALQIHLLTGISDLMTL